ncbi:StbB family protein [Paucibacter sp. R3-3]|uniref:StbB family protein n=1 Tax=Roseateles agri TaxID=3098619 RepID=A0ABU5DCB1_9BURK|nr:StbB family protein [Paucibacter sp. R3-3]MDY0743385.1 StbB family protein [Paucibacter sp. R3-3]
MKIAVINFSGNVGKTTIARHLLLPRIPGAESISVESVNASEGESTAMRGRQFGALQDYLHTIESAVVDIGASNVDDLIHLMRVYRGSHADYDYFVVPTTPAIKQQQDTIATLVDLSQLGVPPARIKLVFNMAEFGTSVDESFFLITAFLKDQAICTADPSCCLGANDIYGRLRRMDPSPSIAELAADETDYKALIAAATNTQDKLALGQRLATLRLAQHVGEELDACFEALRLGAPPAALAAAPTHRAAARKAAA